MGTRHAGVKARVAAARAVDAVVARGRSLDTALADVEPGLADNDRSLVRMICYGTLREHWRLQSWIDVLVSKPIRGRDSIVRSLLATGLYQLSDTRIPDHAAVSATVEATRALRRPKMAGLVNACMRRFQRDRMQDQPAATSEASHNHPQWLIDAIAIDWPDDWQQILGANNARAPMWLRVNRRKGSAAAYLEQLAAAGVAGDAADWLDSAIRLESPLAVNTLPGFADGKVSVQDGAAQIAAPWLLAAGSGRVLDACAAPGNKSAHLLEAGDDIELTCVDIDEGRLGAVRENLDRLQLAATVVAGDASKPDEWWNQEPFDGILLDAPCSATGVIRRHPDIKLLRRATDVERLSRQQRSILEALWPLLKPGGRLLYVTCSVLAAENEHVAGAFLREHADAGENELLPNNNISAVMQRMACGYQVLPGVEGMDGFYFACLEKAS